MGCLAKWLPAVLLCAANVRAQGGSDAVPGTVAGVLGNLSARANVIFAGQVVEVRPRGGAVEIEFRVDQSLQGTPGATYVLREWAGLWAAGQQRYRTGERVVVFLQTTAGGLGSPVDGMNGILPLQQVDALAPVLVDVSRLCTAALRGMGEPMVDAPALMPLAEVKVIVTGPGTPSYAVPVHGTPVLAPPDALPVATSPVRGPVLPDPTAPDEPRRVPGRRGELPLPVQEMLKAIHAGR